MKKIKPSFLAATILSLLFFACSKDNSSSTGGACTISNPIVGKWTFTSEIIDFTTTDGDVSRDTTVYSNGSYVNFQCDGSISEHVVYPTNGTTHTYDSSAYYSISGNTITFYGSKNGPVVNTETIQNQTANSMVLYFKFVDSTDENTVEEAWLMLTK
jgi:hypothetical protein